VDNTLQACEGASALSTTKPGVQPCIVHSRRVHTAADPLISSRLVFKGAGPLLTQVNKLVDEHSGQNKTPLTPTTANRILEDFTPPGGHTLTGGKGVEGADIQLRNGADQTIAKVEVKAVDNFRGFQRELSDSTSTSENKRPPQVGTGDTLAIQLPDGTDVSKFMNRYWGNPDRQRSAEELDRLSRTFIVIYDQKGNVLMPKQPIYNPPEKP
jgi:hypothetical protein